MDVTELKHKEELLINQSRHAAMGEMISMIAHQWRQPLSIISMSANNMLLDIDLNTLDVSEVEKFSNNIVNQTIHLSKTIDDFSNFFKPEKTVSKIKIETILNETYNIVKDSLVNNNIQYLTNIESHIEVNAYQRELMQVFLNIINNSKYALIERKIENAFIHVNVYDDKKYIHIEFYDNAHGIDEKILSKVFEPYFTTKNKNGTGLGLYMSKMIIEKHLNGNIDVKNTDVGVCFKVSLLIDNPL
jgi:signal transduction histidine kinase